MHSKTLNIKVVSNQATCLIIVSDFGSVEIQKIFHDSVILNGAELDKLNLVTRTLSF